MSPVLLVIIHLALWSLWKLIAERERKTRRNGRRIPRYMSSDVGNPIGFSLVAYAYGLLSQPTSLVVMTVAVIALCVTYMLDSAWKRDAQGVTVGLYLQSGHSTLAGKFHLVYVWFVLLVGGVLLLSLTQATLYTQLTFLAGICIYGGAVALDRWRGVI